MSVHLKRYDVFGWDYESINPLSDKEVAWHLKFAQETGGPVLELACGTARLLSSMASAGFDAEGIDLSSTMVKIASRRISQLPPETQSRIRLHRMDMSDFHIGRKFGLIFIADNSFRELKTKEQQLSCLHCVHRHLRPGGKFLATVRRFDPSKFEDSRRETGWSRTIRNPATGDRVMRTVEVQLTAGPRWLREVMVYRTTHADGSVTVDECSFEFPAMMKDDYLSLFSEAGFSSRVFVGYEDQEDDGEDQILCFVCHKPYL